VETTFDFMAIELTQEVSSRLEFDRYGWLTTMAKSGQPVPRLLWFFFDGREITVLRDRLAALYGSEARLVFSRLEAGRTEAVLEIPERPVPLPPVK